MNLTITQEAKEYILSKGKEISLVPVKRSGWAGTYSFPVARMGKPDNPEGYNTIAQEDITIFIDPNIKDKNIKVSLTKWLFIKSLTAEAL